MSMVINGTSGLTFPDGSLQGIGVGRRNLIINGAMQVAQRGDFTSATALPSDAYYGVDRWKMWDISVSSTFTHTKNVSVNGINTNSLKMQATSSATGRLLCRQIVERDPNSSYSQAYNREMTFSVWMRSNSSNARPIIWDPTTSADWIYGDSHTGGGGWEKLTVKWTGGTSSTSDHIEVSCNISSNANANVSISSGDYIEIAFAQLEVGSVATPFEHRSYGEELALCQRYYQRLGGDAASSFIIGGNAANTSAHYHWVSHLNTMRALPTSTINGTFQSSNVSSVAMTYRSISGFAPQVTPSASGRYYWGTDDTGDTIEMDAEL